MIFRNALFTFYLTLVAGVTTQAAEPNEQVIIDADKAVIYEKQGKAIYSGSVSIIQGKTHITADKVEIQTNPNDNSVTKLIASGQPAHLSDHSQADNKVEAQANIVTYSPNKQTLHLDGQAKLKDAQRQFQGDKIDYDLKAEKIEANSSADERVKLVIPANSNTKQKK